jgi:hypothetical protein
MNLLQLAPCFKPLHFLAERAKKPLLLKAEAFITMIIAVFRRIYKGQIYFTVYLLLERKRACEEHDKQAMPREAPPTLKIRTFR